MITRLVSGAQTGADRAALDVAKELGLPCGGWVPRGRLDENGRIPDHYKDLRETTSKKPSQRTRWNVRDSDGTLIVSRGPLTGGSRWTVTVAKELSRPWLHLDFEATPLEDAVGCLRNWLQEHSVRVLNVAGPRASKDPEIGSLTRGLLRRTLSKTMRRPASDQRRQ